MNKLACPIELKFADNAPSGVFEGYASVFGVVDSHRDVMVPDAFKATIATMKARGFNVPMYIQHGVLGGTDNKPVGVWESIEEDQKGLAVKGRLLGLETDIGRYNFDLVKGGALRGISIAYRVPSGGATYGKTATEPRRKLKQVDLGHIALVDNPSNHMSFVSDIKSIDEINTIREFEDALRNGTLPPMSSREAKAFLADGFKALKSARDAGDESETVAALIRSNIAKLTHKG